MVKDSNFYSFQLFKRDKIEIKEVIANWKLRAIYGFRSYRWFEDELT